MSRARLRLVVAAVLFVGWLGWLGYLAMIKPRPVVVSHAQALTATHAVVGKLKFGDDGRPNAAVIEKVLHGQPEHGLEPGAALTLANLDRAKFVGCAPSGDATYVFLLERNDDGYLLAVVPRSPGHDQPGAPLIYPSTPEVQRQLSELLR